MAQQVDHDARITTVEAGERFVEHGQFGAVRERHVEIHALALPLRQRAARLVEQFGDAERLRDRGVRLHVHRAVQRDDLRHAEMVGILDLLQLRAEPPQRRRVAHEACGRHVEHAHVGAAAPEAEQRFEQRGLAGTVRPDDRRDRAEPEPHVPRGETEIAGRDVDRARTERCTRRVRIGRGLRGRAQRPVERGVRAEQRAHGGEERIAHRRLPVSRTA